MFTPPQSLVACHSSYAVDDLSGQVLQPTYDTCQKRMPWDSLDFYIDIQG